MDLPNSLLITLWIFHTPASCPRTSFIIISWPWGTSFINSSGPRSLSFIIISWPWGTFLLHSSPHDLWVLPDFFLNFQELSLRVLLWPWSITFLHSSRPCSTPFYSFLGPEVLPSFSFHGPEVLPSYSLHDPEELPSYSFHDPEVLPSFSSLDLEVMYWSTSFLLLSWPWSTPFLLFLWPWSTPCMTLAWSTSFLLLAWPWPEVLPSWSPWCSGRFNKRKIFFTVIPDSHPAYRSLLDSEQGQQGRAPLFCKSSLWFEQLRVYLYFFLTVKKNITCSGDPEILHEIIRDTTRKSEKHEQICVLSRAIPGSISEFRLHFISIVSWWVHLDGVI